MTKWAYLVTGALLVANSSNAQKLDRVKVLEAMRQDCPAQYLPDKRLIDLLLMDGRKLSDFCECLAVRVASQLDEADFGKAAAIDAKVKASRAFCLVVPMKNK